MITVTPDAERSMATYLGAATFFSPDDIHTDMVSNAQITYFEGYLFEEEKPRQAFIKACDIAHAAGCKTAITLSDSGCVARNREAFLEFITHHIDLVFANADEAKALFDAPDIETAISKMQAITDHAAITLSEKGSIVLGPDGVRNDVPAVKVDQVVDTTGAGDAYAGGFLYGFTKSMTAENCAQLGSLAAAEVISHIGPRPEIALKTLAQKAGLL